jgi:hypothetical protein
MQLVYLNLTNSLSNKTHLKSDFVFVLIVSVSDNSSVAPSVSLRGFLLFHHLARTISLKISIIFISL